MDPVCSYGPRCQHNGKPLPVEECPKCKMRWLHHACQCRLEADYPSIFENTPMGKFCFPCLLNDAKARGVSHPFIEDYLAAAAACAQGSLLESQVPTGEDGSIISEAQNSLGKICEDEATSPSLATKLLRAGKKRGRPMGSKNKTTTIQQCEPGDGGKEKGDPGNTAKGSPFTADELQLLLTLRLSPKVCNDFRSKTAKNTQLWKMLAATYNRTFGPDRTRNAEALKSKFAFLHAAYRHYVDQVKRYQQSGAPAEDVARIPQPEFLEEFRRSPEGAPPHVSHCTFSWKHLAVFDFALPTQSIVGATLNRRTKPDAISVAPPKRLDDDITEEQVELGPAVSGGNIVAGEEENDQLNPSEIMSTEDRGLTIEEWEDYGDALLEDDTVPLGGSLRKRKSSRGSESGGRGRTSNLEKLERMEDRRAKQARDELQAVAADMKSMMVENRAQQREDMKQLVDAMGIMTEKLVERQKQNIECMHEMQKNSLEAFISTIRILKE